jgi:hypothetical protein
VRTLLLALACALFCTARLGAQPRADDPADRLLRGLEAALNAADRARVTAIFAATVEDSRIQRFADDLLIPDAVRAVVKERDRAQLEGAPPGDGYSLVVEMFVETPGRARILTTSLDLRRPPGGDLDSWRVVGIAELTSVEGLYKLRLDTNRPLAARNFEITSEDLVIALDEGTVFPVECDDGTTGLVLLGRGEFRFSPAPAAERGQLRIFADTDTLNAEFDRAFVRMSPVDYRRRVNTAALTPGQADARRVRQAEEVFREQSPRSFSVDLQDLSRDAWHLLPPPDDFIAEVNTRRFDTLTYSRSTSQAEDVTLFRRQDRRTIALYASVAKLAARGRFYSDDVLREFDVLDYNVDAYVNPERETIQARARLALRVRSTSLSTLTLRLAEPLNVSAVTSVEYGRLLHFRIRNQNTLLINLPRTVAQDSDLTLVIAYAGRLDPQGLDLDTVQVEPDGQFEGSDAGEVAYLLSNRVFWYPQNAVPDYATATLRITVPNGWRPVATGEPASEDAIVALQDIPTATDGQAFAFRADQPLRYLAVVITRGRRVGERVVPLEGAPGAATGVDRITVAVEASPQLQGRARTVMRTSEDILTFYTSIVGDAPYTSATIALVASDLPGGHAPGYFAVLNEAAPNSSVTWRGDPAAFDGFPDFFLAHELAHQWWGQGVGWKNYHEQWLSEGFSQYFAALYAKQSRGDRVFTDMLRQFRRWTLSESDQGPVYLGYRLGHIKADLRVFRAIVYNKGAGVLHMLRRLLGDDVFFSGIRQFYAERRYQKAGTDDFERAMEAVSGRTLDRFFERWIYNAEIPTIVWDSSIAEGAVTVRFEQLGELVFDLPVTVTLSYADGSTTEVIVPVTAREVEHRIPTSAIVRRVEVNRDHAALAEIEER